MTIDDDGLIGAPWYVRAFVRVGLTSSLAAVLVWYLMTNVTGALVKMSTDNAQVLSNQAIIIVNQARIIEVLAANARESVITQRFLAALCYNVSTGPMESDRCANAGK